MPLIWRGLFYASSGAVHVAAARDRFMVAFHYDMP